MNIHYVAELYIVLHLEIYYFIKHALSLFAYIV